MRPGDCELVNEIYLEIRSQIKKLGEEEDTVKQVDISCVIDNLAEAAEHIAGCRKMIYEDVEEK